MGFVKVAERHQAQKAEAARKAAEAARKAEAKQRIKPTNPWAGHGGSELPKKVGLLDRIYRPVRSHQIELRAREKEAEALIPQEARQWRWSRLNPGLDEFGWVRTDRSLQSFERCPICSANDGHGAHRLHLGRHSIKELQQHARSVGVAPEVIQTTVSHAEFAPEQTKHALIATIIEARHFKHHVHSAWRKHTAELRTELAQTPTLHESALRRELEALTLGVLVERAEEAWAAVKPAAQQDDATETAYSEEQAELGKAHELLITRIIALTPPSDEDSKTIDPAEREDKLRIELEELTPAGLRARAKDAEVDEYTIQNANDEEAVLVNMIMETSPPSLATHAGEAGVSAQEISAALKRGGEGYLYRLGERQEGKLAGPLQRTGYWAEPSALMGLAVEAGKELAELLSYDENGLRALIQDTAAGGGGGSKDKGKDREDLIVRDWKKQLAARAELTKLVHSGSHRYAQPHPKHTESQLKQHLLTSSHGQTQTPGSADDAAKQHAQRLGSSTVQTVNPPTTRYHRRGGPQRNHPKYKRIGGKKRNSGAKTDGIPVEDLRKRAAARGIAEGTLLKLQHEHEGSEEAETEALLALLMVYPGQLAHLTAEQPKGVAWVRRNLMSMPIKELRERLLPAKEELLLSDEEKDLPADERRVLTLQRMEAEEKKNAPSFIPVDWPEPEEEIEGAYGLPPGGIDYSRASNLRDTDIVPPVWEGWRDGYVFKKGDKGLGYYKDPSARNENIERAKLVREILGPLAIGMNLSAADIGKTAADGNAQAAKQQQMDNTKPSGPAKGAECWGKPGCLNPSSGLHHKGCPCYAPNSLSPAETAAAASEAAAPAAWLEKAVSHAASAVASNARMGCDLPSNQRNHHRWQPIGNGMPARADRRAAFQKHPVWDEIALSKGGLAASVIDPKNGGVRHLIGPSIGAFDERGRHVEGDSDRRFRKMLSDRKKSGQPPARHDYWLDKHTSGTGPRAQLPPDPGQPICETCGKRHSVADKHPSGCATCIALGFTSCVQRIHRVISRAQHRAGSRPCLGKPRCLNPAKGVHHKACPCIDVILENEDQGITATKAVAVEFAPRQHLPFDIHVEPDAACPFGAVITIGTTVEVGHAASLHIEGLHKANAMGGNTRTRGNKGDRKTYTVPLGDGLTSESHSHRVMPGSELKPVDSDSDDEDAVVEADTISAVEGPSEELLRWNEMSSRQRAASLEVFRQLCDSDDPGESRGARLEERLSGIVTAASRYRNATDLSTSLDSESSNAEYIYDEQVAMQSSLRNSGVFSDLGRADLLQQWSEGEWEEFRSMQLDRHAAEGDKALLEGCVGTMAVGEVELAALQNMADSAMGIATMADAPRVEAF